MNSTTRVYEAGYRRFEGERKGTAKTFLAIYRLTIKRSLGLRRGTVSKIFPILIITISFAPAIVMVGIQFLSRGAFELDVDNIPEYMAFLGTPLFLFASFLAPEALSADRRYGIIGAYLSSMTTRIQYLGAKCAGIVTVMLFVTIAPSLLLFIAIIVTGNGPEGIGDILLAFVRLIATGLVVAMIYGSVATFFAAISDKRSVASAGAIFIFVASGIAAGLLGSSTGDDWPALISPGLLSFIASQQIFGNVFEGIRNMSGWSVAVAATVWGLVGFVVALFRYSRIQVK